MNIDISLINLLPRNQIETLDNHDHEYFIFSELYGNDYSSDMDEHLFLQEDLYLQEFQMESDVIIKYFHSGITPFDQEDGMIIIGEFCVNLRNLSNQHQIFESHHLKDEFSFDKQLTTFSQNSKLSQVSRTLQPTLMVMLGSCHDGSICDFDQFMILLHFFLLLMSSRGMSNLSPRILIFFTINFLTHREKILH